MEQTEKRAIDALLEQGTIFKIQNRGVIAWFKKESEFVIKEPCLGDLLKISQLHGQLEYDNQSIEANIWNGSFQLADRSIKIMCKIAAYALLAGKNKGSLYRWLFTWYLKRNMKPSTLLKLIEAIIVLCNLLDFINSIRLIRAVNPTAPKNLNPEDDGG